MAHFAGHLDPASILLHRHGHLPIMHIEPQIQSSDHYVVLSCLVPDSLRYCSVWFIIHNADSLAASADKLSAHVIYFDTAPSALNPERRSYKWPNSKERRKRLPSRYSLNIGG